MLTTSTYLPDILALTQYLLEFQYGGCMKQVVFAPIYCHLFEEPYNQFGVHHQASLSNQPATRCFAHSLDKAHDPCWQWVSG